MTHKRCPAVNWPVIKVRPFVIGTRFIVRTDHQEEKWISDLKKSTKFLERWRMRFIKIDQEVIHMPGPFHKARNGLFKLRTMNVNNADIDVNGSFYFMKDCAGLKDRLQLPSSRLGQTSERIGDWGARLRQHRCPNHRRVPSNAKGNGFYCYIADKVGPFGTQFDRNMTDYLADGLNPMSRCNRLYHSCAKPYFWMRIAPKRWKTEKINRRHTGASVLLIAQSYRIFFLSRALSGSSEKPSIG